MNRRRITSWAVAGALLAYSAISSHAITLTVDPSTTSPGLTPYVLGDVVPDTPAGPGYETGYVTALLGLSPGGDTSVTHNNQTEYVYRSMNVFSALGTGTTIGSQIGSTSTSTSFSLGPGAYFLMAKYQTDAEVWFLDLTSTTSITIPGNAWGTGNNQYGLSGWNLYQANGLVPDGGLTVALLGGALALQGLVRRRLR